MYTRFVAVKPFWEYTQVFYVKCAFCPRFEESTQMAPMDTESVVISENMPHMRWDKGSTTAPVHADTHRVLEKW